jgi:PhnB protein
MLVNAYLNFPGNCEEALNFYQRHLGAKITARMTWDEQPGGCQGVPDGWNTKIMHAAFTIGESLLMASDCPPSHYEAPKGIAITLNLSDPAEAERVFAALSEGGSVQMPLDKTFWAEKFGLVTDRFGIPWMVNCISRSEQSDSPNTLL